MRKLELQVTLGALASLFILASVVMTATLSSQGHNLSVNAHNVDASPMVEEPKYLMERVDPFQPDPIFLQIPGYELVWHDEFNVDGPPDPQKWNLEHGFVRNRELQWYQKDNAYCKGGVLVIEGRKERIPNPNYAPNSDDWRRSRQYAKYTSSSLNTWGKFAWKLSEVRIVARARIHPQPGYFLTVYRGRKGVSDAIIFSLCRVYNCQVSLMDSSHFAKTQVEGSEMGWLRCGNSSLNLISRKSTLTPAVCLNAWGFMFPVPI